MAFCGCFKASTNIDSDIVNQRGSRKKDPKKGAEMDILKFQKQMALDDMSSMISGNFSTGMDDALLTFTDQQQQLRQAQYRTVVVDGVSHKVVSTERQFLYIFESLGFFNFKDVSWTNKRKKHWMTS